MMTSYPDADSRRCVVLATTHQEDWHISPSTTDLPMPVGIHPSPSHDTYNIAYDEAHAAMASWPAHSLNNYASIHDETNRSDNIGFHSGTAFSNYSRDNVSCSSATTPGWPNQDDSLKSSPGADGLAFNELPTTAAAWQALGFGSQHPQGGLGGPPYPSPMASPQHSPVSYSTRGSPSASTTIPYLLPASFKSAAGFAIDESGVHHAIYTGEGGARDPYGTVEVPRRKRGRPPGRRTATATSSEAQPSKPGRAVATPGSVMSSSEEPATPVSTLLQPGDDYGDDGGLGGTHNQQRERKDDLQARNRAAATRYRAKTQAACAQLEQEERQVSERRQSLMLCADQLREEVYELKNEVLRHANCDCPHIQNYLSHAARQLCDSLAASGDC